MPNPPHNPNQDARGGNGRYVRSMSTAERDAQAAHLRSQGKSYRAIATALDIDVHSAFKAVKRALAEVVRESAQAARDMELGRLDDLYAAAMTVLERQHLTVSHGRVVEHDGAPIEDDAPVLAAIDRLVRISERRARLLGLDAPSRVSVDAEQLGAEILALLNTAGGDEQPSA